MGLDWTSSNIYCSQSRATGKVSTVDEFMRSKLSHVKQVEDDEEALMSVLQVLHSSRAPSGLDAHLVLCSHAPDCHSDSGSAAASKGKKYVHINQLQINDNSYTFIHNCIHAYIQ